MKTGYSIVAFIWTIACASYDVYGQNSPGVENVTKHITRDASTRTPTTPPITSSRAPDTEEPVISIDEIRQVEMVETKDTCMETGRTEFFACLDKLGENSMKHFTTRNLTEFLADLCSADVSKPSVECMARHFRACPEFLEVPHVQMLQFGPYHIKDIMYFSTVDHMCECSLGLVCVQKLNEIKLQSSFTRTILESPLVRVPDYKTLCDETTGKFVGCTRKNLERCKFSLNQRFNEEFTLDHAEEVIRMYNFRREHCDAVLEEGFDKEYMCIDALSKNVAYEQCLVESQYGSPQKQLCEMRECVHRAMGHLCNSSMVDIYIDGINIFRNNQLAFLNYPCSSAVDIGFSFLTVIISFVFVVCY